MSNFIYLILLILISVLIGLITANMEIEGDEVGFIVLTYFLLKFKNFFTFIF